MTGDGDDGAGSDPIPERPVVCVEAICRAMP